MRVHMHFSKHVHTLLDHNVDHLDSNQDPRLHLQLAVGFMDPVSAKEVHHEHDQKDSTDRDGSLGRVQNLLDRLFRQLSLLVLQFAHALGQTEDVLFERGQVCLDLNVQFPVDHVAELVDLVVRQFPGLFWVLHHLVGDVDDRDLEAVLWRQDRREG